MKIKKGMNIIQVRIPRGLVTTMDKTVRNGIYVNRSDFIRDAMRKMIDERERTLLGRFKAFVGKC